MVRQKRRLGGLFAVFSLCFAACGDEPTAALRAAIAEGCTINSECSSPLVCAFRTCHIECETTRDCVAYGGGLCVQSDKPYKVCQNPDEKVCERNSDCPGKEICGPDGKCRDACATDRDCVSEQICTAGACADKPDLIDGKLPSKTTPQGGLSCLRASDCPGDLVCKFDTCTVECVTPKDCEDGLPCIASRCQTPPVGAGGRGGSAGAGTGGSTAVGGSAGSTTGGSGGAGAISGAGGASGSGGTGASNAGNGGGSTGGRAGASGTGQGGSGQGGSGQAGNGQAGSGQAGNGQAGSSAGSAGTSSGAAGSGDAGQGGAAGGQAGQSAGVGGGGQGGDAGQAGAAGAGGGTSSPPLELTVLATTVGSTYLALDRDNVYWMTVEGNAPDTKGTVYSIPKLGGARVAINTTGLPVALGLDQAFTYFGRGGQGGSILRVKGAGSKPEDLTAGLVGLTDFAVEDGNVVFTDASSVSLIDLVDPAKSRTLVGGAKTPYTMTRRGGFVFWADAQTETLLLRAPIGPGAIKAAEALVIAKAPKAKPQGIAVDASRVFWTEPETLLVRSASSDGGDEKTLVTAKASPYEIALDEDRVYWTGTNDVSSMKKDGTDVKTYDTVGKAHRAVAVDDTWVFWVDAALGTVNRIGK